MFSTVLSAALQGLQVEFIDVEADLSNGLPMFHMVGYLSSEVKEAGERVRTAIRNSGLVIPAKKIVVNLSPADVRKRGTAFDIELFIKNRPGLVLMDITMPEMTGLEALEEILKTDPEAKVIMCSAIGQQSMIIKSLEMGAMGFIVKPFEKNEFEATIRSVIGQPEN